MFDKVKAIEANFDAHDLNISEENKIIIWNEVDVCILVISFRAVAKIHIEIIHCFLFFMTNRMLK